MSISSGIFGTDSDSRIYLVKDIIDFVEKKEIDFDKYYQRAYEYWKEKTNKKSFIESILAHGVILVSLTLSTRQSGIDGKHRCLTLKEFKDDKFDINVTRGTLIEKKKFSELSDIEKSRFLNAKVPVVIVKTESDKEENDIFKSISKSGVPLSGQVIIEGDYHDSDMYKDTNLLYKEDFWKYFKKSTLDKEAERRGVIAKLFTVEKGYQDKKLLIKGKTGCNLGNKPLPYQNYKHDDKVVENVKKFFDWTKGFDLEPLKMKKLREIYLLWFLYKEVENKKIEKAVNFSHIELAISKWSSRLASKPSEPSYAEKTPNGGSRGQSWEAWEQMLKWSQKQTQEIKEKIKKGKK
jgi:hypothetical protein